MKAISGTCNNCGQCCGCETAPNRCGPFPGTWPDAVRNWTIESLETNAPVFKLVGHPRLGGDTSGKFKIATGTYNWIWVPGEGLVADAPPWGNTSSYEPQCPVLMARQPDGTYPCGIENITINMPGGPVEGNDIRASLGCRWLPATMRDIEWDQWITDHPNCSYIATDI